MKWWMVALLGATGCLQANDNVLCPDGRTCPEGTTCAQLTMPEPKQLCLSAEDALACEGKDMFADCSTKLVPAGRCYEGVCQASGCGNRIVDPGELCDDGNQVAGDGCSHACQSDETCGNGFLDPVELVGPDDAKTPIARESCDDGGTLGHDGCSPNCQPEQAEWTKGSISPGVRRNPAMAFDTYRGRVIMFGGGRTYQSTPALGDTFQWDGNSWTTIPTVQAPNARHSAVMAYDSDRKRVVLFGGVVSSSYNDLWELDNETWRRIVVAGALPEPRFNTAMVYDSKRKRLVLFGGNAGDLNSQSASDMRNDTWEFDGTSWTETTKPGGPIARWGHAMIYDPVRGVVVMTGGYDDTPVDPLRDTWEYADGIWTQRNAAAPTNFALFAGAFDPISRKPIVFGGQGSGTLPSATYAWDGATWTAMAGSNPAGRINYGMATDFRRGRVVMYAGRTSATNTTDEVWERTASGWQQAPLAPPPSMYAGAALLPGSVVLFGGCSGLLATACYADTWLFDGLTWRKGPAGPSARMSAAMAADTKRGQVVLFGGYSGFNTGTTYGDTWIWNGSAWNHVTPATSPPARWNSASAYDAARDRVVLFGGNAGGAKNDTWEWDGSTWANVTPANPSDSPPARTEHMMAYDPVRQRVVMFGGYASEYQAWEWDGTVWAQVPSMQNPPARSGGVLVWNPFDQALLMIGGRSTADGTWERRGTEWVQLSPPHEATPRVWGTGFPLPDGTGTVFLGGVDPDNLVADATSEVSLFRYVSAQHYETCYAEGGADNDGDGASGCEDLDCWNRCTPSCPPNQSCDTAAPHCGDAVCSSLEDCALCPADCGVCTITCGDATCSTGETAADCPGDC